MGGALMATHVHLAEAQSGAPRIHGCVIRTSDGSYLTAGRTVLIQRDAAIEARVTELTEPGALLNAFVGRRIERYRIVLTDGRCYEALLTGTTWQQAGRRQCRFTLAPVE
jgi:hypothetical protein